MWEVKTEFGDSFDELLQWSDDVKDPDISRAASACSSDGSTAFNMQWAKDTERERGQTMALTDC